MSSETQNKIVLTKTQLEAVLDYMEMYGVEEMHFTEEALNSFAPAQIKVVTE